MLRHPSARHLCSPPAPPLHTGTASYDLEKFRTKQCKTFLERGVDVRTLDVARTTPPQAAVEEALGAADAVLVQAYTTPGAVAHVPADRAAFVAPDALRSRGRDGGDESDPEQEFSDDEAQAAALGKVVI